MCGSRGGVFFCGCYIEGDIEIDLHFENLVDLDFFFFFFFFFLVLLLF
jgi:hypothetical protein